jgi:hypothetical protein
MLILCSYNIAVVQCTESTQHQARYRIYSIYGLYVYTLAVTRYTVVHVDAPFIELCADAQTLLCMMLQGFLLMEDMLQNHPQPDHTILEHIIFGCGLRGHWNRARKLLTTMPTRRSLKLTPTVSIPCYYKCYYYFTTSLDFEYHAWLLQLMC